MVLRYYKWLPLELEPDYMDGYTCDHCHRDFLEAPFYHEEATGTDYCVQCGADAGYTPFSGLVASLLFSSRDEALRDADSNAIALFAYKLDAQTVGIYFANASNVLVHLQMTGAVRDAIVCTFEDSTLASRLRISAADVARRFPWLGAGIAAIFDLEIRLHGLPTVPVPMDDVCVLAYDADDDHIEIRLTDSFSQLLDVRAGRELVVKSGTVTCAFAAEEVDDFTKGEATSLLRKLSA